MAIEDLGGALGRKMFYRADRFRARELFRNVLPHLRFNDVQYILHDASISGLGATVLPDAAMDRKVGERVSVRMDIQDRLMFAGAGEVVRVDTTVLPPKIGVRLLDRCLNIPELVATSQEMLLHMELDRVEDMSQTVAPEYRQHCADVVNLLRGYKTALNRLAKSRTGKSEAELFHRCEARLLPRWRDLWHVGNELVAPFMLDESARAAAKQLTELVVTPELLSGAIWKRSFEKPLGYPGDYQIMNMVYDWRREGDDIYGQLVHRIGLDVAECIATRMVMMREAIARAVLGKTGRIHITNVGCGSAREVVDYLRISELPQPVHFTLVDQDHGALTNAYEQILPKAMRFNDRASVQCLHVSFNLLLKGGRMFGKLPPQDLIFSVGLTDYLSNVRAQRFITSLYTQLAPQGQLIIGNMARSPRGNLWPMEFVCDWSINYRDDREMRALAADLPQDMIRTEHDSTGRVCLITVQKP